jgi:hypothetical protein
VPEPGDSGVTTPGLHHLTFAEYLGLDAVNHSTLKLFGRSPLHAHEEMLHPRESTPAQQLGQAVHCAVLEPSRFESEYVVAPKIDRRFKENKVAWKEFEGAHRGAVLLSVDDYESIEAMRDAVLSHQTAAQLLGGKGLNETSAIWTDEKTGLLCKARLDRITSYDGWPLIVDVKTSEDASERAFQRSLHSFGYHSQGAWYVDGLDAIKHLAEGRRFSWIVVESKRPYAVACYELDAASLEQGREENRRHLDLYARCRESGEWPGYPLGLDYSGLPYWAFTNQGGA